MIERERRFFKFEQDFAVASWRNPPRARRRQMQGLMNDSVESPRSGLSPDGRPLLPTLSCSLEPEAPSRLLLPQNFGRGMEERPADTGDRGKCIQRRHLGSVAPLFMSGLPPIVRI